MVIINNHINKKYNDKLNILEYYYINKEYCNYDILLIFLDFFINDLDFEFNSFELPNLPYNYMEEVLKHHKNPNNIIYNNSLIGSKKSFEKIKLLKKYNILDIDKTDNNGRTLLMLSAMEDKPEIATYLLLNGANPNIIDKYGNDVYHYVTFSQKMKNIHFNDMLVWSK